MKAKCWRHRDESQSLPTRPDSVFGETIKSQKEFRGISIFVTEGKFKGEKLYAVKMVLGRDKKELLLEQTIQEHNFKTATHKIHAIELIGLYLKACKL